MSFRTHVAALEGRLLMSKVLMGKYYESLIHELCTIRIAIQFSPILTARDAIPSPGLLAPGGPKCDRHHMQMLAEILSTLDVIVGPRCAYRYCKLWLLTRGLLNMRSTHNLGKEITCAKKTYYVSAGWSYLASNPGWSLGPRPAPPL